MSSDKTASRLRKLLDTRLVGPDTYEFLLKGKRVGSMTLDAPGVAGTLKLEPEFQGMGLGKKMLGEVIRRQPNALLDSGQTVTGAGARLFDSLKRRGYDVTTNPRAVRDEIAAVPGYTRVGPGLTAPHGESVFRTSLPQESRVTPVMDETPQTIKWDTLPDKWRNAVQRRDPQAALGSYAETIRRRHPEATDAQIQKELQNIVADAESSPFSWADLAGTDPELAMNKTSATRKDKDIELWEAYKKNPGPVTLEPLMRQVEPLIQSQVNKWSGAIARPVLESKGKQLALEAIKSYNPNAGAALSTHIMNRLQKLSRAVYTHQDAIRIPEYKKLRIHAYMRGQREIMDQVGREPTNDELADHLGWSPGRVSEVQQTMRPEFIESEDFGGDMFERKSVWASDSQDGLVDMIYYDLDPIDKQIFEHSTGYSGKPVLSNPEIMKKTGLTQGQLSYRKRQIIDKIDSLMD